MANSARQMFNTVIEFCKVNSQVLMIVGIAILALIVLTVICVKVKQRRQKNAYYNEAQSYEYDDEPNGGNESYYDSADDYDNYSYEMYSRDSIENDFSGQNEEKRYGQAYRETGSKEPERPENHQASTNHIENLLEELSGLSYQNLEEVEIKLQGAEVRLKYANYDDMDGGSQGNGASKTRSIRIPASKETYYATDRSKPKDTAKKANSRAENAQQGYAQRTSYGEMASRQEAPKPKAQQQGRQEQGRPEQRISPQTAGASKQVSSPVPAKTSGNIRSSETSRETADAKIPYGEGGGTAEDIIIVRKFGPGNMNTTRSGRVYTEEELKKQISY